MQSSPTNLSENWPPSNAWLEEESRFLYKQYWDHSHWFYRARGQYLGLFPFGDDSSLSGPLTRNEKKVANYKRIYDEAAAKLNYWQLIRSDFERTWKSAYTLLKNPDLIMHKRLTWKFHTKDPNATTEITH